MEPTPRVLLGTQPGEIAQKFIRAKAHGAGESAGRTLDSQFPYLILYNADTVTHTVNAWSLGEDGLQVPLAVKAGQYVPLPSTIFAKVLDTNANGNLYSWPSDVPLGGPSVAAGSGAPTVTHHFGSSIQPNANGTYQMGGLGSFLTLTPKVSGTVRLTVNLLMNVTASGDFIQVLGAYGTGVPPAKNAAAIGTTSDIIAENHPTLAGISLQIGVTAEVVFTGLTLGTQYWFDVQVLVTSDVNDGISANDCAVEELPW